jgi:hypothetical protein
MENLFISLLSIIKLVTFDKEYINKESHRSILLYTVIRKTHNLGLFISF